MRDHKKYFEEAYRTGTDTWTHLPWKRAESIMVEVLPAHSMILDVGAGRGLFAFHLAKAGFRVIGIDYIPEIIEKNNKEVANRGMQKELRFVEGDALDIPFTDTSFDAIVDVGLFQHMPAEDFGVYINEVSRVLKPKGYFLNITLSKETVSFWSWFPRKSAESTFVKDGIEHHFFTKEKITHLWGADFDIITQFIEHSPEHGDTRYLLTLMRKK